MMQEPYNVDWLPEVEALAREAGALIMHHRAQGVTPVQKADHSPVTEADQAADRLICNGLKALTPQISVVSEEGEQSIADNTFWCVDPLDGTKGFIRGEDYFTVNIGLVVEGAPVMGVMLAPALATLYAGIIGHGAERVDADGHRETIRTRSPGKGGLHALISTYHGSGREQELRETYGVTQFTPVSSAYKFCLVAEGSADLYPRIGPTMEWDTAAGQAIVEAAGGVVQVMETGQPLRYDKPGFKNPHFVVRGTVP